MIHIFYLLALVRPARADHPVHYLVPPVVPKVAAVVRGYHAGPLLAAANELVEGLATHRGSRVDLDELIHAVGHLTTEALRARVPSVADGLPTALRFLVAIERGTELASHRGRAEGELRAVLGVLTERVAKRGDLVALDLLARLETPLATTALLHLVRQAEGPARVAAARALYAKAEAKVGGDRLTLALAQACAKTLLE